MRRADKEVTDRVEVESILQGGRVCHLGLNDCGATYVLPVNYGYAGGFLYVHSAGEGRKIDILRSNAQVSFCIYIDDGLAGSDLPCNWGMRYRSVMGTGTAAFVEGRGEKEKALRIIVDHYAGPAAAFEAARLDSVCIIRIRVDSLTGKKSG